MQDQFFEGKDFKHDFKALMPQYYPSKYKKYIKEETRLLKLKLKNKINVLEAGVGIGRLIPDLAPIVKNFVGVDNAKLMLKESQKIAKKYSNVTIMDTDLEKLDTRFPPRYFDISICVWNTLGNVKNEVQILKKISKVTKGSIFITVYYKGTLKNRENWYKTIGIKILKINKQKEIFYSKSGLKSKSYNLEDIERIAKSSHLKVKNSKILSDVMLWVELVHE